MKNQYDRTHAKELVPLLESITREIVERHRAIRFLEQELAELTEEDPSSKQRHLVLAELASQRRELRMARGELDRLGCTYDEQYPHRVYIPGRSGKLEEGFRWQVGDLTIHRRAAHTSTAS